MERITAESGRALGERLRLLGITPDFVRFHAEYDPGLLEALSCRRETQHLRDPAALLFRLLFCGETLTPEERHTALGDMPPPPPLHFRSVAELIIASDYLGPGAPADAVMGAGETTAVLWRAARPAHRVATALDLGCGAGSLALLLAAHADTVIGTDINRRAVEFGRFNAALNGIANVEFVAGDLYEPVAGKHFDLIVSQPPYYPGEGLTFLHGGRRGDEIARRVVTAAAGRLTRTGRALILSSWPPDSWPMDLAGHDVLALTADRCEVPGAAPGLVALQPGTGASAHHRLSAECWGEATSADIDGLFAGRMPAPSRTFEEDGVEWEVRPLFGVRPAAAAQNPSGRSGRDTSGRRYS